MCPEGAAAGTSSGHWPRLRLVRPRKAPAAPAHRARPARRAAFLQTGSRPAAPRRPAPPRRAAVAAAAPSGARLLGGRPPSKAPLARAFCAAWQTVERRRGLAEGAAVPVPPARRGEHALGLGDVMSKTRDSSEPAPDARALQGMNPAHSRNIRPGAAPSAAPSSAARDKRARPAATTTRLPAPPAPPALFQACQYAFLISVAHGFTPFMMMPAAFAGVSPPSPRCRLMQL